MRTRYSARAATATALDEKRNHVRFGLKLKRLNTRRFYPPEMASRPAVSPNQRPREWRRRVVLAARMRTDSGWSDACILNISSRGLMIRSRRPAARGSMIELRHGDHAIVGRVVWSDGAHAGLQAEQRLPVEQILSLSQVPALQLTAVNGRPVERRKRPRSHEDNRARGRLFEFAAVAMLAASVAGFAFDLVHDALAKPLAAVQTALGG